MSQLFILFRDSFYVIISERNVDGENNVRRRSRKKSMTGSGAREHKEQLEKLQQKVRFVAFLVSQYMLALWYMWCNLYLFLIGVFSND